MKVRNLWPTPIGLEVKTISDKMRKDLINVLIRKDQSQPKVGVQTNEWNDFAKSKKLYSTSHYNLFLEAEEHPEWESIREFEKYSVVWMKEYMKEAFDMGDDCNMEFTGRCFGNVQYPGGRTFPHYHQLTDIVMIHYLDIGRGIDPEAMRTKRHSTHALLLLDPRGSPNFPWYEKIESITPENGLTVFHPAYLWHETNPWRESEGIRVCIVVNFQIAKPGYGNLHRPIVG